MLVADPDYFGKLRVLLFNLRKGAAEDPAYRNAFGKSAAQVEAQVKQSFADHDIRTTSIAAPAGSLSGGNQQKVIVARELSRDPAFLVASQPTRGLDVGSIEYVHHQIIDFRNRG